MPDKRLKTISAPVAEVVSDDTRALMDDMLETMYHANGIGLAAIQIGVAQRIIVMDISQSYSEDEAADEGLEDDEEAAEAKRLRDLLKDEKPRFFVNPEIIWTADETRNYQEGCLSVPGFYDDVARPPNAKSNFSTMTGSLKRLTATGFGDLHSARNGPFERYCLSRSFIAAETANGAEKTPQKPSATPRVCVRACPWLCALSLWERPISPQRPLPPCTALRKNGHELITAYSARPPNKGAA